MEKETSNRMETLACIIADLKAENMMMTERVHQLTDENNDMARQLIGKEKRKDEDPPMMDMRDHCDKLERENEELKRFAKAIHSFVNDKKLYMARGMNCPYYQDGPHVCSTFCLECDSCLGVIEGCGVICRQALSGLNILPVR